jgi:hypothetical protein
MRWFYLSLESTGTGLEGVDMSDQDIVIRYAEDLPDLAPHALDRRSRDDPPPTNADRVVLPAPLPDPTRRIPGWPQGDLRRGLPADLDEAHAQAARLRPALRRRIWPPMTYMQIPSVLSTADRLLAWLAGQAGPDADTAQALYRELLALRADFRRDA